MRGSVRILGAVILALLLLNAAIWQAALRSDRRGTLSVSFLDVGQGDAIFIEAPSGHTALIDGGPADGGILRRLSSVTPWYARSIDVVIPTHPDADHVAGLIDVLARYRVSMIIRSSVEGDTQTAKRLTAAMRREGAREVVAMRGQIVNLGDDAYLEILSPDRSVPHVPTNDGCVVTRLVYGATAFMLPCDAPQAVEKYLVSLDGNALHADVLKAGHHGSRTSSSPLFIGFVDPQWVVYSRGCNNKYGFPHAETVATMTRFGIPTLDTCKEGTITFYSDGAKVWRE